MGDIVDRKALKYSTASGEKNISSPKEPVEGYDIWESGKVWGSIDVWKDSDQDIQRSLADESNSDVDVLLLILDLRHNIISGNIEYVEYFLGCIAPHSISPYANLVMYSAKSEEMQKYLLEYCEMHKLDGRKKLFAYFLCKSLLKNDIESAKSLLKHCYGDNEIDYVPVLDIIWNILRYTPANGASSLDYSLAVDAILYILETHADFPLDYTQTIIDVKRYDGVLGYQKGLLEGQVLENSESWNNESEMVGQGSTESMESLD